MYSCFWCYTRFESSKCMSCYNIQHVCEIERAGNQTFKLRTWTKRGTAVCEYSVEKCNNWRLHYAKFQFGFDLFNTRTTHNNHSSWMGCKPITQLISRLRENSNGRRAEFGLTRKDEMGKLQYNGYIRGSIELIKWHKCRGRLMTNCPMTENYFCVQHLPP
jgi:hypothetical protein